MHRVPHNNWPRLCDSASGRGYEFTQPRIHYFADLCNIANPTFPGGAPLSPETHEFVRTVMGCPILQAYGLTETCANTTAMDIHDNSTGAVGPPNQGVHIKLVNWEEGNYRCGFQMGLRAFEK